jgi:DNA-binding LacI/PurR family transcriptional regulator
MSRSPDRITIDDVARRAGVSAATVSRVINQSAGVSEEKASQVWAAIHDLDYVPHTAAQTLAANHTHTLGLLLPAISGGFFVSMLAGIESGLEETGYDLLTYSTRTSNDPHARMRRPLGDHNTDGLLVFADSLDEDELRRLADRHFPVVLLHRSAPEGTHLTTVTFENKSGARKAVDHLIDVHGRRRIVYVAGPEQHEDSYWRRRGYREALDAHHIPFDPALVVSGDFEEPLADSAITDLLAAGVDFDGVFSGDDESAIGVMNALQRAGRRIPQDVSVVGFDDVEISRHLTPPLTTVHAPIETAGLEAVRQLVQLVRTGSAEPLVLLPTDLVIRRSCGCAA